MHGAAEPGFRRRFTYRRRGPGLSETADGPRLAIVYCIAELVMNVAGPLFWAALVLAFITGVLGVDLFH
jgi:hypothetical protein